MLQPANNPWLHAFAVLTALSTLVLLGIGGLVTSHGVGMAVPDWPTTYGYNMFFFPFSKWIGGIFYEHSHRLVASAVGLMTAILAVWFYGRNARPLLRWLGTSLLGVGALVMVFAPAYDADGLVAAIVGAVSLTASLVWPRCERSPRWLRRLGVIAFVLVVAQGILGGLRVTMFKDEIGIFHGTLAQLFFLLIAAIALFTSRWWQSSRGREWTTTETGSLGRLFLAGTILILLQLMIGATMRHQHAGLAIPDFPLAYGKLWPAMDAESIIRYNQQRMEVTAVNSITAFQVGLQMVHRIMALVIFVVVPYCAWAAWRKWSWRHPLTRVAALWAGVILVQVILGAATIWSNKAADIATAHVVVGALSLVTGGLLCIICFRSPATSRETLVVSATQNRAATGDSFPQRAAH